jgi:hypothetical protein
VTAEPLERLRATLGEMNDLVGQLRSGTAMPRSDECKKVRRLEQLSQSLSVPDIAAGPSASPDWAGKREFLRMTIDDIVEGRCGERAIGRPADFADFYLSLQRYLGDMIAMCERRAAP